MEAYNQGISEQDPAFFLGALVFGLAFGVILRTALTLYAWKRGQKFHTLTSKGHKFGLLHPMVRVEWQNKRWGDLLVILHLFISGATAAIAASSGNIGFAAALSIGSIVSVIKPHAGNIVLALFERYEIEPRPRKPKARRSKTPRPTTSTGRSHPTKAGSPIPPARPKSTHGKSAAPTSAPSRSGGSTPSKSRKW